MTDGGRNAAKGFLYQYIRTLEALLEAAAEDSAAAIHVEGKRPAGDQLGAESIDYELTDRAGRTLVAVQVKGRAPTSSLGATDIFWAFSKLVHDRDAARYQLITNALLGESGAALVAALQGGPQPRDLRRRIDKVLASAGASRARRRLQRTPDFELNRLRRAEVIVDRREDIEVQDSLRTKLRNYRNSRSAGLGNDSAGLMAGYLISEVFKGAAEATRARLSISEFKSKLMMNGTTIRTALGRRDWAIVIGAIPTWPDVYRREAIELIATALPCQRDSVEVTRCTLVGMSGIGKSSLAVGYIMDRADLYQGIYWIDAESDATLLASFMRVLMHLSGGADNIESSSIVRGRVHDMLAQSASRWLMVFDNCIDSRAVERWIPRAGNGHVIVTSTNSAIPSQPGKKIEVGPMANDEALSLLARRLNVHEDDSLETIALLTALANAMERWPLALELAAAYIDSGGIGIRGIPNYLATLKIRSLSQPNIVPLNYPRTLVEAIYLCLERIEGQSRCPDDPAGVAASAIWFAAYLSSRRIPAHLLVTSVLMDPEGAGGFKERAPMYMAVTACPTPEVVSLLRTESLVNLDEPLPNEGLTDPGVPDAVISVNSVLQEVLRDRRDTDPRVEEHLLGRLAYHTALWLSAAHDCSDYPRTLAFATHATAIDEHATRLGVNNDYIAFMRGNLAGVLQRLGDEAGAAALLRAEITHLENRSDEHCTVLCFQARIMLAGVLAYKEPPASEEVLDLLGKAYPTVQALAATAPTVASQFALGMRGILHHCLSPQWGLNGQMVHALTQLEAVVADFLEHLPETDTSIIANKLEDAEAALNHDPRTTISLCQEILDKVAMGGTEEILIQQLLQHSRRLMVEALIDIEDFARANQELRLFLSMTEPARVYVGVREQLVHNAGRVVAFAWLRTGSPTATLTALLRSITAPELLEPIAAAFAYPTSTRIAVLQAIRAFVDGDMEAACAFLEAYRDQEPKLEVSARDAGWAILARLAAAHLNKAQEAASQPGNSPTPTTARRQGPWSHSNSQSITRSPKDVRRFIAPDLLIGGLPGPGGIWLRGPHPGEVSKINELLNYADDELDQPVANAIDACTLTSTLMGILQERSMDELAEELYLGGADKMISGSTIVLVAVDPSRRLIGAIQTTPPFELLTSIRSRRISRVQKQAAVGTFMKITGIGVVPSRRREGVGTALTKAVADLCWRFGYRVVYGQFDATSTLDRFFAACDFDVTRPAKSINFAPYGLPLRILPMPGNRFFVVHYDPI